MNKRFIFLFLLALQNTTIISMQQNRTILMLNIITQEFVSVDVNAPIPGDPHKLRPLHRFAALDAPLGIVLCLMNGADINGRDKDDNTPLIFAALKNHTECVRVLLESGADGSLYNIKGFRAVDFSKFYDDDTTQQILKDHNAYNYPTLDKTNDKDKAESISDEELEKLPINDLIRYAKAIKVMRTKKNSDSVIALYKIGVELGIYKK